MAQNSEIWGIKKNEQLFDIPKIATLRPSKWPIGHIFNKKASWLHAELCFVFVECCVHIETTWCPCGNHVLSMSKECGFHMETM